MDFITANKFVSVGAMCIKPFSKSWEWVRHPVDSSPLRFTAQRVMRCALAIFAVPIGFLGIFSTIPIAFLGVLIKNIGYIGYRHLTIKEDKALEAFNGKCRRDEINILAIKTLKIELQGRDFQPLPPNLQLTKLIIVLPEEPEEDSSIDNILRRVPPNGDVSKLYKINGLQIIHLTYSRQLLPKASTPLIEP